MAIIPEGIERSFKFIWWVLSSVAVATATVVGFQATITARVESLERDRAEMKAESKTLDTEIVKIGKSLASIETKQASMAEAVNDIKATIRDMKAR